MTEQTQYHLSLVIPTYNEKENIAPLVVKLKKALKGLNAEIIFVDDNSPDGTMTEIERLARKDPEIKILKRVNQRGLSSACVAGLALCQSDYVLIMDADMQHDESIIKEMYRIMLEDNLDIVVGSRYIQSGSMSQWSWWRRIMSWSSTQLGKAVLGADVKDPLSGYFIINRRFFQKTVPALNLKGFKILLDILLSSEKSVRIKEVGYSFRGRQHGQSKLGWGVAKDYFALLWDKRINRVK